MNERHFFTRDRRKSDQNSDVVQRFSKASPAMVVAVGIAAMALISVIVLLS